MKTFKQFFAEKNSTQQVDSVVLWPGGFKPPHAGHFEALKVAIQENDATHAVVFIGPRMREGVNITPQQSKAIWEIYLKHLHGVACEAVICPINPIKPVYDYVDQHLEDYVNIIVAAGDKEGDVKRYDGFKKHSKYNKVKIKTINLQAGGISGTLTRQKLASGDIDDALEYFLPSEVKKSKSDVTHIKHILTS